MGCNHRQDGSMCPDCQKVILASVKDVRLREYWIVLLDDTPDIPGSSNRHFRVEHAPPRPSDYGSGRCLEIVHVREVKESS